MMDTADPTAVVVTAVRNRSEAVAAALTGAVRVCQEARVDSPRSARYDSLDLWRGIACLIVVVHHGVFAWGGTDYVPTVAETTVRWIAARLWIGVPMFFVISGYCIAAAVQSPRFNRCGLGDYAWRRFRRIYPPAWIVIVVTCLIATIVDVWIVPYGLSSGEIFLRPWWVHWTQWLGNFTLTETWRHHLLGSPTRFLYLGHYWTLCYEEQFYAVMGILAYCLPKRLFVATIGVTVASIAAQWVLPAMGLPIVGFFFDGSWLMFALGVLVYFATNRFSPRARLASIVLLLATAAAFGSQWEELCEAEKGWPHQMLTASVFASVLIALFQWDEPIANVRWLFPLMLAGQMCYSLYLVHLPVTRFVSFGIQQWDTGLWFRSPFVTIPLCVVLSFLIAWPFHVLVERRFLNSSIQSARLSPTSMPA